MTPHHAGRNSTVPTVIYVCLVALFLSSCARDYVTGRPSFTMVDEAAELRIGTEEDKKIVALLGVYDDEKLGDFVETLGQKIVKVCHRPNLKYSFKVVDSPVLNAFALPGGYVYVTRGLLASVNSTDELVGVMSHEVGHVAGRHSAEQISKQHAASGFGLLNVVSAITPRIGGLLSAPSQLLLLSHSRKQEKESDKLGVEYTTRLGYDSRALARFFSLLQEISDKDGHHVPTFLSTHPASDSRSEKVLKQSQKWQDKLNWTPKPLDTEEYLALIDGLVFGENPRHGFTKDGYFYHPDQRFEFPYRKNWALINSHAAVIIVSPKEEALIQLTIEQAPSPKTSADRFIAESGLVIQASRPAKVSELNAHIVESTGTDQRLRVLSYFIQVDDMVYVFHAMTHAQHYSRFSRDFLHTLDAFKLTSDRAILEIKPYRVRIRNAEDSTSLRSLVESWGISPEHYEAVGHLNGKKLDDSVEAGETLKIVIQ